MSPRAPHLSEGTILQATTKIDFFFKGGKAEKEICLELLCRNTTELVALRKLKK